MTLQSRLPQVAARLDDTIEDVLRAAARDIVVGAKARVPVSDLDKPHLRDAIHYERDSETEYRIVAGDTDAWYGHIVEHGSVRASPRPFLVPAFEARKAALMREAAAAVTRLGKTGR